MYSPLQPVYGFPLFFLLLTILYLVEHIILSIMFSPSLRCGALEATGSIKSSTFSNPSLNLLRYVLVDSFST